MLDDNLIQQYVDIGNCRILNITGKIMSLFEYKPNSNPDDLLFWLVIDISNTQKDATLE